MNRFFPWRWSQAGQILGGLALGIGAGLACRFFLGDLASLTTFSKDVLSPLGTVFLRLIFMVMIPLILSALALGVYGLGDVRQLGAVGLKCLGLTILLAAVSVVIGIGIVNLLKPGKNISPEQRTQLEAQYQSDAGSKVAQGTKQKSVVETLLNLIPRNPLAEAVASTDSNYTGGGMIAVMVFALIFGVAMALQPAGVVEPLARVLDAVFQVSLTIIGFAMKLAPFCVALLGFHLALTLGAELVTTLGFYAGTVVLGLALQMLVTYPAVLLVLARRNPWTFFRDIREVLATAFSTSSSNATLPTSLRVAETELKLPAGISRFVLTVGASANQNGTALYEGVTVLFLAQVFGPDLSLGQQAYVALMCIITGFGVAGVPGGSLPLVAGVLVSVGTPPESIALILGIDRLLDMCRTVLNVAGDLVIATVVSSGSPRSE